MDILTHFNRKQAETRQKIQFSNKVQAKIKFLSLHLHSSSIKQNPQDHNIPKLICSYLSNKFKRKQKHFLLMSFQLGRFFGGPKKKYTT